MLTYIGKEALKILWPNSRAEEHRNKHQQKTTSRDVSERTAQASAHALRHRFFQRDRGRQRKHGRGLFALLGVVKLLFFCPRDHSNHTRYSRTHELTTFSPVDFSESLHIVKHQYERCSGQFSRNFPGWFVPKSDFHFSLAAISCAMEAPCPGE